MDDIQDMYDTSLGWLAKSETLKTQEIYITGQGKAWNRMEYKGDLMGGENVCS